MRRLMRLLRYARPYAPHLLSTVVLMALVGLLDAFRLLLIGPMLDRVLHPASQSRDIALFTIPGTQHTVYLQSFVPQHFQNAWTMVAVALVAATVIKGICFYAGTYLVNLAGFGVITDLRNELYASVLRRSAAFFQKHTTGTLVSAIVNDIDKIQFATSQVLAEFLQQFFSLIFIAAVVVALGGKFAWVLLVFVPFIVFSAGRLGQRVRSTTRKGQDRLAEIQNILHETLTGNRIVKAFGMEGWETSRFHGASRRLLRANMRSVAAAAVSSPMMDIFGAIAISLLLLLGRDQIKAGVFTPGSFVAFIFAVFKLYDPVRKFAGFYNNFQQALGASSSVFQFMDADDEVKEKPRARRCPPLVARSFSTTSTSATMTAITARCCVRSIFAFMPAKCWRLSAPADRARARSCICCRAFSMSRPARSALMAMTCAMSR